MWEGELPSEFKHGDKVFIDFYTSGKVTNGIVLKVAFTGSQVFLDIEIEIDYKDGSYNHVRLHNVNSAFVFPSET